MPDHEFRSCDARRFAVAGGDTDPAVCGVTPCARGLAASKAGGVVLPGQEQP